MLLVAAACRPERTTDPAILTLGTEAVHRSEFDEYVAGVEARGGAPLTPEVRRSLLETFLEERLLVLEARGRRQVERGAGPLAEQAAVQKLLRDEVMSKVRVRDEDVEAYCRQNAAEFGRPETVALHQILVPTLNEARDIERRLRKDPRTFEMLARTRSRGPEASTGGDMGRFSRGQLPAALEAAAFALPAGGTSAIVSTELGHHVLRVDARDPAREASPEECLKESHARLQRVKSDVALRDFIRGLMSRAKVNHAAALPVPSPR
jgi:parvulin-like peptidyl-prolyl isomerase